MFRMVDPSLIRRVRAGIRRRRTALLDVGKVTSGWAEI
ncbi:hypothetical protein NSERUTF1_1673 [Nocardia seriolae]|nr:hypothetical protein NSERUTF1_1673 [Nocardia seriolae]